MLLLLSWCMTSPMLVCESGGKKMGSRVNHALPPLSWPLHWGNWGSTLHQGQTQNMWHVYVQAPGAKTLGPVLVKWCPWMARQG